MLQLKRADTCKSDGASGEALDALLLPSCSATCHPVSRVPVWEGNVLTIPVATTGLQSLQVIVQVDVMRRRRSLRAALSAGARHRPHLQDRTTTAHSAACVLAVQT